MTNESHLFLYLDPGFLHDAGHYRTWRQNIERELVKREIKLLHVVSEDVPQSLVEELELTPVFRNIAYIDSNWALSKIKKLGAQFGQDLQKAMALMAAELESAAHIHLYMYTSHPVYIQEIARYLATDCPYRDRVQAHLVLFYLDRSICNDKCPSRNAINLIRSSSNVLEQYDLEMRIALYMDSELGINKYQPYFERSIRPHVMPLYGDYSFDDASKQNKPPVVGYFGYTTEKHGFHFIKQLLHQLEETNEIGNFRFILKVSDKFLLPVEQAQFVTFVEHYQALDNFTINTKNSSNAEYLQLISQADIVLVPYESGDYRFQTSSVFVDAVMTGAAVLVATGSWMAKELQTIHSGATYVNADYNSFSKSFRHLVRSYARLQEKSHPYRKAYVQNFLASATVELALGSTHTRRQPLTYLESGFTLKKAANKIANAIQLVANHGNDRQYMKWALHHRKGLVQFEKKHAGEKCFIIGNGPSLNQMDLTQLKDCRCIGLNKIYLHPQIAEMGIDYHVSVNPLVIAQSLEKFQQLNCPSFVSYRAFQGEIPKLPGLFFIMTMGGPQKFSFHPYDVISEGGTVTYVALQLAYFMGFSEIYLIGVDHNFVAQGKPNEKQLLQGPDPNHFHPDYFSGHEWHLPDLEASEIVYRLAQYYFSRTGRKIYDATVNGRLNIFEKVGYDTALRRCRRN